MKMNFVVDGSRRFWRGKETLASRSFEQKYAAELARANPAEKETIHKRMAEENLRREKVLNHKPSAATLW
jgi:hypothetical protein